MGQFEAANAVGHGPREGALAVTEKFTFHQLGRDGTAINRHKVPACAVGLLVQHARQNLFAGAAFAGNQHGGVGWGHGRHHFAQGIRSFAVTDVMGGHGVQNSE